MRLRKLGEAARGQLVQERQENQILLQELKSKTQLVEKQLEQEREETLLQLEALEAETKREVDGLKTENARLRKDMQELQERNMRDPSMLRMAARRPSYRGPETYSIQSELRIISGQDIWLRDQGTQ